MIELTMESRELLKQRLVELTILFDVSMSPQRLEVYIAALLRCPHLTTFDRMIRSIDMATWQLNQFPSPSELNNMFQHA